MVGFNADSVRRVAQRVVSPRILGPIFKDPSISASIIGGFHYPPADAELLGVEHRAIDIAVARGTKIIAPMDGWYMASYSERRVLDEDGQPKQLSVEEARAIHPGGLITPPHNDDTTVYFGSFVVQGYCAGKYIQLAHLDSVSPVIPYHQGEFLPNGDRLHSKLLRIPPRKMPQHAVFLEKGDFIGLSGMTGCGWGSRHYDLAHIEEDGRPNFDQILYSHYDLPHVHLCVFGPRMPDNLFGLRMPRGGTALFFLDPYGQYSADLSLYPDRLEDWSDWPGSLWVPQV